MLSRRAFLKLSAAGVISLYLGSRGRFLLRARAQIPGGTLDPLDVQKYQTPLLIPPVMPRADVLSNRKGKPIDYYEISMKQFSQQILPAGLPATTVWGYGASQVGEQERSADPQRAIAHYRSQVEATGAREVDQRPGGRRWGFPPASVACRSDPALG